MIDSGDVPDGCWVEASALVVDSESLTAGQRVVFNSVPADDVPGGLGYRAVRVWPDEVPLAVALDQPTQQGQASGA